MNKGLVEYLDEYMLNPDPQYAIMINGKWGCGKTFFIKKWMKAYEESKDNTEKILKPIYISLYGLKETTQITSAINRVLYPFMYGKAAKISKAVWKCASALVFKQELNLNGDEQNDMSINIGLDSLSILKSDDESIKSDKFLIFDDIERCLVDMTELLGYINYFVEHCHCRVLIIGDEGQIGNNAKPIFDKFKEKTIGREFLLNTEKDAAIDYFVKEEFTNQFLISHIEDIKKTFQITGCNNLRILRQCLWDFSRLETLIESRETERYEQVLKSLLCSFIAAYCEYKGENKTILQSWRDYNKSFIIATKEDESTKKIRNAVINIQNKYNAYPSYTIFPIFHHDIVDNIIEYIESGISIVDYVNGLIQPLVQKPTWERHHEASIMSNDEFILFIDELIDDIVNTRILRMSDLGNVIAYLSFYDTKGIRSLSEEEKQRVKESLPKYLEHFETLTGCHDAYVAFKRGINSFMSSIDMPIITDLCENLHLAYEKRMKEDKNELAKLLETLNDDNCDMLYDMNNEVLPDKSTTYDSVSIFNMVDIDSLFLSIKNMGNKGRQSFNSFIRHRYKLSYNMGDWTNKTEDDILPLEKLKEKIDDEIQKRVLMEKYSFEIISNAIAGAINRCKGDLNAQN